MSTAPVSPRAGDPLVLAGVAVPDHLPGEPPRLRPTTLQLATRLLFWGPLLLVLALLSLVLWPVFLLSVARWGWPPNVPRWAQVGRALRLAWTARPPPPGLRPLGRVALSLTVLRKVALIPLWGLAWHLDGLLYGAALQATPIVAPLFEVSAARSGSTQLARYLEEDPRLAAPSMLQCMFPFLWLWRLAPVTLGRVLTPDRVRAKLEEAMPPAFVQRHEGDPFRTDTFDALFFLHHLLYLAPFYGPEVMAEDFSMGVSAPHNQRLWRETFVALVDGIGRKTLVHAGAGPDGQPRRFFLKGHFLAGADGLERRYPDARFLTVIRAPAPRLQSGVNFLGAGPAEALLGAPPWAWLGAALAQTESLYCEAEQAWFTRTGGARRTVIRFSDYVRDLESAMRAVYRECLDSPDLPDFVPRVHPPRDRANYLLNRSLAEVGVDEAALNARLAGYIAWCRGEAPAGEQENHSKIE